MNYPTVASVPSIYQWDDSSRLPPPDPGSAPENCGPTCVTFIANFYRNAAFGINATRTLGGVANRTATSIGQQRTMLARRGVGSSIGQPSVVTMRNLVATGRRPILIGLDMSRVPLAVAGHPFRGMHAVVLRGIRTSNGIRGFDVLDPNYSQRTGRTDPTDGHRFYPEYVIEAAFRERTTGGRSWALIPSIAKQLASVPKPPTPLPDTSTTSEDQIDMAILKSLVRGTPKRATVHGGAILYALPGRNKPRWTPDPVQGSLQVEDIGGVASLDGSGFWRVLRRPIENYRGVFFAHPNDVTFH